MKLYYVNEENTFLTKYKINVSEHNSIKSTE